VHSDLTTVKLTVRICKVGLKVVKVWRNSSNLVDQQSNFFFFRLDTESDLSRSRVRFDVSPEKSHTPSGPPPSDAPLLMPGIAPVPSSYDRPLSPPSEQVFVNANVFSQPL